MYTNKCAKRRGSDLLKGLKAEYENRKCIVSKRSKKNGANDDSVICPVAYSIE